MIKLVKAIRKIRSAKHRQIPFPASRLLLADVMREGRRKNTVHEFFEADITDFMAMKAKAAEKGEKTSSVTAYIAACFAYAVGENPELQAYRTAFGKKLVIFEDVDIVFTVEKTVEGAPLPWTNLFRACNRKTVANLDEELRRAKNTPIEGTGRWAIAQTLMRQPRFIRRLLWLLPRYSPFFMKRFVGTVGVTAIGMYARGSLFAFPITPMTLTLTIGSIDHKPVYVDDELVKRDKIILCVSIDHDIVDGARLARFIDLLQDKISSPTDMLTYEPPTGASS